MPAASVLSSSSRPSHGGGRGRAASLAVAVVEVGGGSLGGRAGADARSGSRLGGWRRSLVRLSARVHGLLNPSWMTPLIYNTFRYGLVLLYLGTLFVVIGYHNPWVGFIRYVGLAMVALGLFCVGIATGQSCFRGIRNHRRLRRHQQMSVNTRIGSSISKDSLPTYDIAINDDLPNYEEANELRLNPKYLSEYWSTRHSLPAFLASTYFNDEALRSQAGTPRPLTPSAAAAVATVGAVATSFAPPYTLPRVYEDSPECTEDVDAVPRPLSQQRTDSRPLSRQQAAQRFFSAQRFWSAGPAPRHHVPSIGRRGSVVAPMPASEAVSPPAVATAAVVTPVGNATATRPTTAIMRNRGETVRFIDIPEVDLGDEREVEQIILPPPPRSASARPNTTTIMTSYSSSSFESDGLDDNASAVSSDWDSSSEAEDDGPVTFAAAPASALGQQPAVDDVEAPLGSDDVNAEAEEERDTFPAAGVTPSASSSNIDGGWTRPFTAQVEPIGKAPEEEASS